MFNCYFNLCNVFFYTSKYPLHDTREIKLKKIVIIDKSTTLDLENTAEFYLYARQLAGFLQSILPMPSS